MEKPTSSQTIHVTLVLEVIDGLLHGRVLYDENLIVETATNVEELQAKMKQLLFDFHDLEPKDVAFKLEYDLTAFFEEFSFLKITKIAELSGVNGSLMRQYATGKKSPSAKQVEKIAGAVKVLANQLNNVHIYAK